MSRLSIFITMATTAGTSTPSSPLPSTASTLWALLDHYDPSSAIKAQPLSHAQVTPQNKAGTSTRILLHDTHARLEKFSERANSIFSGVEASRREMVRVREEVESAREKELDTIAQLSMFFFRAYMLVIGCSSNAYTYMHQSTDASLLSRRRSENQRKRVKLL
jgi:hypothetical protein